ncbi:MAG: hypothetical protein FJW38_25565 [Acidobacteria bacterium]|nr:hypothetical protein [Acidobacteriota bacterium]
MHLEPGLLMLPYRNRWSRKPVGHKVAIAGALLIAALVPASPFVAIASGVLAGLLACWSARVSLHTWLELLTAPILFAAVGGVIIATSGSDGPATALATLARVFGAASATLLLTVTTPILDVVALVQRRRGFRTLSELFLLSFRAIVAIGQSGFAMINALRIRGLGQSWHTAPGIYASFAGALAIRSLQQAHRAEAGLAVRGFDNGLPLARPGDRL